MAEKALRGQTFQLVRPIRKSRR